MTGASTPQEPTCSIRTIEPLLAVLRGRGQPIEPVLQAAKLQECQLEDLDLRIAEADALRAWEFTYELTNDPALGLHAAEAVSSNSTALFKYLAATSATAREAYECTNRYLRIIGETIAYRLEIRGDYTICIMHPMAGSQIPHVMADFGVALMCRLAPAIAGDTEGLEAWFVHPEPAYKAEYTRLIPFPCRFSAPENGIAGRGTSIDRPLPLADSSLNQLLEEQAREALSHLPKRSGLADRVRRAIAETLGEGGPGAEATAARVGLSVRTLRRRLREEGLTHKQLLDEVRAEVARRHLANGRSSGEVAFLVGFSDASAFHKAFRRWTGRSPSDFARVATRS